MVVAMQDGVTVYDL